MRLSARYLVKNRAAASTHKKVVVVLSDRTALNGYLIPSRLHLAEPVDLLTVEGEHKPVHLNDVRAIYFVREFKSDYEPQQKAFLSRPSSMACGFG